MALLKMIQLGCRGVSVSKLESPAYTLLHSQGGRSLHVWWAEFGVWSDDKSHSGQNVVTSSSLVACRCRAGSTLAHRVALDALWDRDHFLLCGVDVLRYCGFPSRV